MIYGSTSYRLKDLNVMLRRMPAASETQRSLKVVQHNVATSSSPFINMNLMLRPRCVASVLHRCRMPFHAALSSMPEDTKRQQDTLVSTAVKPAKPKTILSIHSSPAQNLRNALDALDLMIEEADRKVVKKYRPNMFAEFKQLNDTDGKVLKGATTLMDVNKADRVPSLKVNTLEGKQVDVQDFVTKGDVTLMLTSFKNYGLNMLPAWRDGFVAAMSDKMGKVDPRVQTLMLNVIEEWYMKVMSGSITKGLQAKTPKELHATTFAYFGRCDEFRTHMALDNSFVGYAHLVDAKGRIRWIAGGPATPEELERLSNVTKQLLAQSSQTRRR